MTRRRDRENETPGGEVNRERAHRECQLWLMPLIEFSGISDTKYKVECYKSLSFVSWYYVFGFVSVNQAKDYSVFKITLKLPLTDIFALFFCLQHLKLQPTVSHSHPIKILVSILQIYIYVLCDCFQNVTSFNM